MVLGLKHDGEGDCAVLLSLEVLLEVALDPPDGGQRHVLHHLQQVELLPAEAGHPARRARHQPRLDVRPALELGHGEVLGVDEGDGEPAAHPVQVEAVLAATGG